MNEIRRKLRGQDGVTFVFALAAFLILTLCGYVIVDASLNSARVVYASTFNEQAALSVASASRLMRGVILDRLSANKIRYTPESGWTSDETSDEILNRILNALNGEPSPAMTLETVSSDPEQEIAKAIGAVQVDITAEYETNPRLILNFRQTVPVPYYSCAIITLYCDADGTGYVIRAWDTRSMLGKYETREDTP